MRSDNPLSRSQSACFRDDDKSTELLADVQAGRDAQGKESKDDSEVPAENKEFM
jgi:hypothetical protein